MAARAIDWEFSGPMRSFSYDSSYSAPAVGDLIKTDTSADYLCVNCADGNVPLGILRVKDTTNAVLTVEMFKSGSFVKIPYKSGSAPVLGGDILASDTAGKCKLGGGGGVGVVRFVDATNLIVGVDF